MYPNVPISRSNIFWPSLLRGATRHILLTSLEILSLLRAAWPDQKTGPLKKKKRAMSSSGFY